MFYDTTTQLDIITSYSFLCGIDAAPLLSAAPEMEGRDDKVTITHQITGFEC